MDPLLIIHGPNSPNKNRIYPSLSTSSSILRTAEPNSIREIPQKIVSSKKKKKIAPCAKKKIAQKSDNTRVHIPLVALLGHLH
jgi:hypothetical protein